MKKELNNTKILSSKSITNLDGWQDVKRGLNSFKDKRNSIQLTDFSVSKSYADILYKTDSLAKKIVNEPVEDSLREGFNFVLKRKKESEKLNHEFKRLYLRNKIESAWKDARKYGGAVLLFGFDDGHTLVNELEIEKIKGIKWILPFNKHQIQAEGIDENLESENFGRPLFYKFNYSNNFKENNNVVEKFHASRCIVFDGDILDYESFKRNGFFHESILTSIYPALKNYNIAHESIAAAFPEIWQGIYKIPSFMEAIASSNEDLIKKRIEIMDDMRSNFRALVLGDGEDFDRKSLSFAGIPELLNKVTERLVAVAKMPHTKLLGEGSQGNTSGRTEQTEWYDIVSHIQEQYLQPKLETIGEYLKQYICQDKEQEIQIEFNSLYQQDPLKEADVYLKYAQADNLYINNQTIDPHEVAQSRFSGLKFGNRIILDKKIRKANKLTSEITENNGNNEPENE